MTTVRVLRTDWERLQRSYQGMSEAQLLHEVMARGRQRLAEEPQESITPQAGLHQRLAWLRRWTPRKAASIATLGFDLVMNRERLTRASDFEQSVSRRYAELNREVIPALKERANQLRAEIQRLEEALRARGRDPERIGPNVPDRIEVDVYRPVEFEGEERRKKTLDFFRRIGGDR